MSWENLEGGQEASQHSGEAYRRRVEEYLESGEYLSVGDPHSGTSDIRMVRPAHDEEKVFRIETKNTKASLANESLINEVARQFIDFCVTSEEFEFHIYAQDYADQPRWKDIFRDRTRKQEEVQRFFEDIHERHSLNDEEVERFETLDFDDFWLFLENVAVKKAGFDRLGELIEENNSRKRRAKNWEFYVRENEPVYERSSLSPNFSEVDKYPESVWILPSRIANFQEAYEEIPRYLPIWFEDDEVFSLISPAQMESSLAQFVDVDAAQKHVFREWMLASGTDQRHVATLLNKQLVWRGTQLNDRCVAVRHEYDHKLIITIEVPSSTQQTLTGGTTDSDIERDGSLGSYNATKDMGTAIAHRYGHPSVKRYGDEYYAIIQTGWLFTESGEGDSVITGARADRLHNKLDKNNLERIPNKRAQLRQWQEYLKMGIESASTPAAMELGKLEPSQSMRFVLPGRLELDERPPKNGAERDILMEGGQIE